MMAYNHTLMEFDLKAKTAIGPARATDSTSSPARLGWEIAGKGRPRLGRALED
jgi:hypothetical protein